MEPIISKLQEGVKYPRFERDATKTINDLVDHITKERGVYSSSIEPNPSEHSVWFNTNDNTLYIYNKGVWRNINDKNTDISDTPFVFYCSSGTLYYNGNNQGGGGDGINISGFYNKDRLEKLIERWEDKEIKDIRINGIFIEPDDDATIIIGETNFITDITILGENLNNPKIYMYYDNLHIGNDNDEIANIVGINWFTAVVYCNCKEIGDITIMHDGSNTEFFADEIMFIVGNNNNVTIEQSIADGIDACNIYVIKETDNDASNVYLPNTIYGSLVEYVNLCGTQLCGESAGEIVCYTYITTTIDDIDYTNSFDSPIYMESCKILIIDAHYREFTYTGYLQYLAEYCQELKIYVTDVQLFNFLKSRALAPIMAVANNSYYDDKVVVNYKTTNGTDIYNKTIYKR